MKFKRLMSSALAVAVMGTILTFPVSAAKQTITVKKDTYVNSWGNAKTRTWGASTIALKAGTFNGQNSGQYNGGNSNNPSLSDQSLDFKSGYLGFDLSGVKYTEDAKYELTLQLTNVQYDSTTIYAIRATDKIYTIVADQGPADITETKYIWKDNSTDNQEVWKTKNFNGWKAVSYPSNNTYDGYVSYLSKPMFIAEKDDDAAPATLAYCGRDEDGSTFRFANYAVANGVVSAGAKSVTLDVTDYVNEKLEAGSTEITIGIFANNPVEVYQKEYDNGSKAATLTVKSDDDTTDWAYTFRDTIDGLSAKSFYISTSRDNYNVPLKDVITADSIQGEGSAGIALIIKNVPADVTINSVTVK